jgi:hypothetical protein
MVPDMSAMAPYLSAAAWVFPGVSLFTPPFFGYSRRILIHRRKI